MPDSAISSLEPVDLRTVWPDEASDFTPWLADPENLTRLGDELGLTLEPRGTEQPVGSFSADILCRRLDGGSDEESWVVIENQYGRTNHDHLGKLLTYAAGLNARTAVWIAEEFHDQHRTALHSLNASTTQDYAYFGVEIELVKIDESRPAPRFNIVVQPNDWTRPPSNLTETQRMQLDFWVAFERLMNSESEIPCGRSSSSPYMGHSTGLRGVQVRSVFATSNTRTGGLSIGELRVELRFTGASAGVMLKQLSDSWEWHKKSPAPEYVWDADTKGVNPRVYVQQDAKVEDRHKWPEFQQWLKSEVEQMFDTLVPKAKELA